MKTPKRYTFWRVFWIVLAVYLFFTILGVIAISITPAGTYNLDKLLSLRSIISQVVSLFFASTFYYFCVNEYYRLMVERRAIAQYIRPTVLGLLAIAAYSTLNHLLISPKKLISVNNTELGNEMTVPLILFGYIIAAIFYIGISLLVAYLTSLRDEKKQRKILEAQKMQLEIEKSQANFNFLKAQINPHFLHNTLNFLYAKSLPYSAELSEGILTLSDIMRYALSEGNAKDGKAPLRDEIEHVRNVIKINQLRFSNNLNVQFGVEGVINGATIIPFILITLVENAFKHGDLKSSEHPIVIRLVVEGQQLRFYCRNKKKMGPKELSTGIGLDNIKKRLDLAYGKNYRLEVKDEAEFYTTELTITQL